MNYWNDLALGAAVAATLIAVLLRFFYFPLRQRNDIDFARYFPHTSPAVRERIFFWAILALAFIVRLWEFGVTPGGFNQDGAMAAVDAKALSDYGTDRFGMKFPIHFTAWAYGQMSVLLSYLMVPFIKIGGVNEVTARLPVLLVSMSGILAVYSLIKDASTKKTALIVMFLVAINPWHIMQSRWALDCNLFPHFFVIGCYFLNLGRKNPYALYFSMFAFSLCMYSYGIAFFTVPIFLFVVATSCLIKNIFSIKHTVLAVLVYAFFSWPIWAVMIINFMKWPTIETSMFTIPFFPGSVRSLDILFFSPNFFAQLHTNFGALVRTSFTQAPDLPWNAINVFGTQYRFVLPLVIVGAGALIANCFSRRSNTAETHTLRSETFVSALVLGALLMSIWAGLVIASVNVNRINIIYYPLIICSGFGLVKIGQWFRPVFYFLVLLYFSFFLSFCHYYFGKWSDEISVLFFKGMGDALEAAAQINTPRYYVTVNSQYNGAKAVSEILTLFHHSVDAKYFQGAAIEELNGVRSANTAAANDDNTLYTDRYKYINPKTFSINPEEAAVYIIRTSEKNRFNTRFFRFIDFRQYSLAIQKKL